MDRDGVCYFTDGYYIGVYGWISALRDQYQGTGISGYVVCVCRCSMMWPPRSLACVG